MRRALYERYVNPTFAEVWLQPTTYCNANCHYCYLPGRDARNEMPVAVARAVAASVVEQGANHPVAVVWHGGEPLSMPIDRFARLLDPFEALRSAGKITHVVQTNATLINDAWCELFHERGFTVGVSIDGPETANVNRINWAGRPIFDKVMRGMNLLRQHDVAVGVICVVSPQTVRDPLALLEFFDQLGVEQVGFNIEEIEGVNTGRPDIDEAAVERFWAAVVEHQRSGRSSVVIREMRLLVDYLNHARAGRKGAWLAGGHEPGPAVTWDGRVVLLSPEMMGSQAPQYEDFVVGNVLSESLPAILGRAHEISYVSEFMKGLAACEEVCPFWDLCHGAQASNRFYELGRFDVTETAHCRNTRQAPAVALAASFHLSPQSA